MEIVDHLLSKHNVLKSFSITKRIKHAELAAIKEKLEASGTSEEEFAEKLRKLVMITQNSGGSQREIPGVIINKQSPSAPAPPPSSTEKLPVPQKQQPTAPTPPQTKMEDDFAKLPDQKKKAILALASQMISGSNNFQLTALEFFFLVQIIYSELKVDNSTMSEFNKKYNKR